MDVTGQRRAREGRSPRALNHSNRVLGRIGHRHQSTIAFSGSARFDAPTLLPAQQQQHAVASSFFSTSASPFLLNSSLFASSISYGRLESTQSMVNFGYPSSTSPRTRLQGCRGGGSPARENASPPRLSFLPHFLDLPDDRGS